MSELKSNRVAGPSAANLISDIRAIFPLLPLPKKIAESYSGGPEGEQVDVIFAGKLWSDLSVESIREHYCDGPPYNALFHLCTEAWAYYLPVYLIASLEGDDEEDIAGVVIRGFFVPKRPDETCEQRGFDRVKILNESQNKLVLAYLLYFKDKSAEYTRDQIEYAIDAYWHQFATDKNVQE